MHHSFSKLERIFIILFLNALEIDEIDFQTHLSKLVSNVYFTLKIMNFKNVSLTKSYSILYYLKHKYII